MSTNKQVIGKYELEDGTTLFMSKKEKKGRVQCHNFETM
jgi:hypothetical protein